MLSMAEIQRTLRKAFWILQDNAIPDRMARTEAWTELDKILRRIDDAAPAQRDVIEPNRESDGDVILA